MGNDHQYNRDIQADHKGAQFMLRNEEFEQMMIGYNLNKSHKSANKSTNTLHTITQMTLIKKCLENRDNSECI